MKDIYEFDEVNHVHTLNGKRLYGVTTILGVIGGNKTGALIQWAVNMAIDWIKENCKQDDLMRYLVNLADLEEAKKSHRLKKEGAGDVGKIVHKAIESWLISHKTDEIIKTLDDQAKKMFNNFVNWFEKNGVECIYSEKNIYSKTLWIGGIVDLVFKMNGKTYIGDIKTSKGVYDRAFFFQTAGYDLMLRESLNIEVDGYCIIRLGKDGSFEDKYSYDLEGDRQGFLAALTLFKQLETWK